MPNNLATRCATSTHILRKLRRTKSQLKNGTILERYSAPVLDNEGHFYGRIWSFHDITGRKQAELILRTSEDRFRTIFLQSPLGIAMIDSLNGRIHEVNARFADIAGRSMEEIPNINWLQITHPDDVQADLENMALMNAGKITGFRMEKRYLHPDGTAVWIDMTVTPLKVGDKTQSAPSVHDSGYHRAKKIGSQYQISQPGALHAERHQYADRARE